SDARSRARATTAPVVRFTRDAGVYTAQSGGHANRYQVFVERAIALTRPGGRFGLVLPSGLATDHGSAALRRLLLSRCDVDAIVERAAALFPPLGNERGWSARFGRELNASDDRHAFRDDRQALPIVDGKHVEPFRAALHAVARSIGAADARRLLGSDRHMQP